jgi:site-specific recombinase XerC
MPGNALPRRRPPIPGRQALCNGWAVAVGLQRASKVALLDLHVADLVVRNRQVALPAGVAGIGLRRAFRDGEAVVVTTSKQHLAAVRMCFDWLVTGGILTVNPTPSAAQARRQARQDAGATD